ncbi:MAG: Uma2 family endonuclease, partial [Chloroflexia bacterium]|nr:Uma2 family endonuclease [Chloroflexia bacterium]
EAGLHIDNKNNISSDIAIFERDKFFGKKPQVKYTTVTPKVIIEIDTKADLSNFDNIMEYYQVKTNKLFKFGVEKVFWVLTKNKQIIEAVPNDNWLVKEWDKEIEILENISFSIDQLLKDDEIYDWVYLEE